MRQPIHIPVIEGLSSRQAHADLPEGTFEREVSREGFFGAASHLYHRRPPTGWSDWDGPLRPRAFDLAKIDSSPALPWDALDVLHNAHMRLRYWICAASMPALVRNADGDDLLFIHQGEAELFCDYGHLSLHAGDYVLMPRGTLWRLECSAPVTLLLIEATNGSYQLPDKGLVGPHAIFDPAMLDVPRINAAFQAQKDDPTQVVIKRQQALSTVTFPYNPLDAVGWHGNVHPVRINVKDIRPLAAHRYHLPPSAHTTFVANRFVVCTFAPRPFETDPAALKVPFFHNNDDYEEVLFYHAGNFFSRDHVHPGMMTFHPSGFTHGPHPKALKRMFEQPNAMTQEYAVMIDTRDALTVGAGLEAIEDANYVKSWQSPT
jgi:homogentisate 1,2-dioxygenase